MTGLSDFNEFNMENASNLLLAYNERLETIYGEYFELYNLCISEGYDIDDFNLIKMMGESYELNETLLSLLDAIILIDPVINLTNDEIQNFKNFIAQNNSLIVLYDEDSRSTEQINDLIENYGYNLNSTYNVTRTLDNSHLNTSNVLLKGVNNIKLSSYWIFNDSAANSKIAWNDTLDQIIIGYNNTNEFGNETFGQVLVLGDSDLFKNKYVHEEDNYIFLNNTIHWAINNTLTMNVSIYSERSDNNFYLNDQFITFEIHVQDQVDKNIDNLTIFAIFVSPNGTLNYFLAFFVVDGWYASLYLNEWSNEVGTYSVVFLTNSTDYAVSFGHISFTLDAAIQRGTGPPIPTTPNNDMITITIVYFMASAIFALIVSYFLYSRNRWHRKLEQLELKQEQKLDMGNLVSSFQAFNVESNLILTDNKTDDEQKLYFLKQMKKRYDALIKKSKKY